MLLHAAAAEACLLHGDIQLLYVAIRAVLSLSELSRATLGGYTSAYTRAGCTPAHVPHQAFDLSFSFAAQMRW